MDLRLDKIMFEEMKDDKSFQERGFASLCRFSQNEVRNIWLRAVRQGIEIGLRRASIEGQKIELNQNTKNENHREYLKKFYESSAQHGCAIQYHPQHGMIIIERR